MSGGGNSRPAPLVLAFAVVLGTALLVGACKKEDGYPEVSITTPEVTEEGPVLSMSEWRQGVIDVCREAASDVGDASVELARQLDAEPESLDEGEISRRAFALSGPLLQEQLQALADLRPPAAIAAEYQQFLEALSEELRWTGRIAALIGEDGADEMLREADRNLAASAAEATTFVRMSGIDGCLLTGGTAG